MSNQQHHGISLHVTIHIAPENVDKFIAAMTPVFEQVTAEPECLYFEIFQDFDTPGKFRWVEDWSEDKEWFMKYQATKGYYKAYLEATEPLFVKPREIEFLDRMPARWTRVKAEALKGA